MVHISNVDGIIDINDPAVACTLETLAFCHDIFALKGYKKYTTMAVMRRILTGVEIPGETPPEWVL